MGRRSSVALQYDLRMPAPLVIARGRGELAGKLVDLARQHRIPVVESADLAESLVTVEPGEFIPELFYEAVAEVIGFVWRTSSGDSKKGVG